MRLEAFTLVEVVLVIGIIAFSLTVIVGLVGIAVQGTKDADLDARLAGINRRIVSDLQSQPFLTVSGSLAVTGDIKSYYDHYGNPLTDCYGLPLSANGGEKYFECDIKNITPTNGFSSNAKILKVQIRWPYTSPAATNSSVASILNTR